MRIPPIHPPYSPETAEMLRKWMPPGVPAEPLALFRVLARREDLMGRMRPLGAGLLGSASTLPLAERELVIARVCARCGCRYEWGVHAAAFGPAAGLLPETLARTVTAPADDSVWSPRERTLIRLVDALHDQAQVDETLWADLSDGWSEDQRLELLILVGWYHLIAYVANVSGISPEPWAAPFPDVIE